MTDPKPRNLNSGQPTAESAAGHGAVARRADGDPDSHYEPDPDQIVRVVHQVPLASMPMQGPTNFDERAADRARGVTDVAAIPTETSVWEARPADAAD